MKRAKKNYIYQIVYEALILIVPLITAPYVVHVLGATNLGIFTYTQSIAAVFLTIARLGIVNAGNRSIAEHQNDRTQRSRVFWNVFAIQACATIISTGIYIAYVGLAVKENKLMAIVQCFYVMSSILDIAWFYMGMENFKKTVLKNTFVKILSLILLFLLVKDRSHTVRYAFIVIGSIIIGHLTLWIGLRKYVDFVKPTLREMRKQLKPILVLFIPAIAITLYTRIDKIMIGSMSGTDQVAFYEYAAKIVAVPLSFIISFGSVMLPHMTASIASGAKREILEMKIQKSLVFVMFLSSSFAFGLAAISDVLIPLYYGAEFLACISLLRYLAFKLPIMAWANVVRTQCLIPNHRDREYIISLFAGALVNLLLNYFLIQKMKADGAAIATIIAELTVCVLQTHFMHNEYPVMETMKKCSGFFIIGIIMFGAIRISGNIIAADRIVKLLIEIFGGGLIYLGLSFIYYTKVISKCTLKDLLKSIIS